MRPARSPWGSRRTSTQPTRSGATANALRAKNERGRGARRGTARMPRTNSCSRPCFTTPRWMTTPPSGLQRLREIGDQVVRVLQADGEPHHALIDARPRKLLRGIAGVAEEDGKRGERLGAAQAGRPCHQPQAVPEGEGAFL